MSSAIAFAKQTIGAAVPQTNIRYGPGIRPKAHQAYSRWSEASNLQDGALLIASDKPTFLPAQNNADGRLLSEKPPCAALALALARAPVAHSAASASARALTLARRCAPRALFFPRHSS